MPLAIDLLAHLVELQGCSQVLSSWQHQNTSLVSEGYDRRSNLDLSISLSLSSPRIASFPEAKQLLSLLAMLPDGLSDVELLQSKLPLDNMRGCKSALLRTGLAYSDKHRRLKVLVPIQEYIMQVQPPDNSLVCPLLVYFRDLLEFHAQENGYDGRSVAKIKTTYYYRSQLLFRGQFSDSFGTPSAASRGPCGAYPERN